MSQLTDLRAHALCIAKEFRKTKAFKVTGPSRMREFGEYYSIGLEFKPAGSGIEHYWVDVRSTGLGGVFVGGIQHSGMLGSIRDLAVSAVRANFWNKKK